MQLWPFASLLMLIFFAFTENQRVLTILGSHKFGQSLLQVRAELLQAAVPIFDCSSLTPILRHTEWRNVDHENIIGLENLNIGSEQVTEPIEKPLLQAERFFQTHNGCLVDRIVDQLIIKNARCHHDSCVAQ